MLEYIHNMLRKAKSLTYFADFQKIKSRLQIFHKGFNEGLPYNFLERPRNITN